MDKVTQRERRLRRQIENLRREKERFYREMVYRGEEISCMIRIYLAVGELLPDGPREMIERLARRYAERNDIDRGSVNDPGKIDFDYEARHLDIFDD